MFEIDVEIDLKMLASTPHIAANKKKLKQPTRRHLLLMITNGDNGETTYLYANSDEKWKGVLKIYCDLIKFDIEALIFYYNQAIIDKESRIDQMIDVSKIDPDNQVFPGFKIDVKFY